MPSRAQRAPMAFDLDLERAAAEAESLMRKLDDVRRGVEELQRQLREAAEERAKEWVMENVPPERRAAAEALLQDALRIADEVGEWLVARSPVGLLQRLVPELRAAAEDARRFLEPVPERASVTTPPTPARRAP